MGQNNAKAAWKPPVIPDFCVVVKEFQKVVEIMYRKESIESFTISLMHS